MILTGCGLKFGGFNPSVDTSSSSAPKADVTYVEQDGKFVFTVIGGKANMGELCEHLEVYAPNSSKACDNLPLEGREENNNFFGVVELPSFNGGVHLDVNKDGEVNWIDVVVPPQDVKRALEESAYESASGSENIDSGTENQVQPPDSSGEGPLPLQQEEPSIDSLPRVLTFEDLQNLTEGNSGPQVGEAPQTTPDAEEGETSAEQGDTVEVWSFKITKNDEDESVKFGNITRNRTEIEEYFSGSLTASGACKTDHLSKNGDPENQWLQVDCTSNVDTARLAEFFGITEQELINLFTIQDGITREVLRKVEEVTFTAVTSTPVSGITDSGQFMTTEDYKLPIDRQGLSKGFWIACLGIPTLAVTAAWFTSLYYKFKSRKRG